MKWWDHLYLFIIFAIVVSWIVLLALDVRQLNETTRQQTAVIKQLTNELQTTTRRR